MKRIYFVLFFILLSIFSCEKETCWECITHYEVVAEWRQTGETQPVSSFPRITDSIYYLCDMSQKEINKIESIGTQDLFWIKFGDLYLESSMTTNCYEK